jgi:hypothetical protein
LTPLLDPYVCNVTVPKSFAGSRELHLISNLVEVGFLAGSPGIDLSLWVRFAC